MKTVTLSEFIELAEHENWTRSQEVPVIEERVREEWDEEDINIIPGGYGTVQNISILGGVTISYAENFEYDDFAPSSLKIHAPGDYEWVIEGVEVVGGDGGELDTLDLISYFPPEFSVIDYSFLMPRLRRATDVDDGVDHDGEAG